MRIWVQRYENKMKQANFFPISFRDLSNQEKSNQKKYDIEAPQVQVKI